MENINISREKFYYEPSIDAWNPSSLDLYTNHCTIWIKGMEQLTFLFV